MCGSYTTSWCKAVLENVDVVDSAVGRPSADMGVKQGGRGVVAGRDRPPELIYLMGWGRSGTTLLGELLGQDPRTTCVGELHYVFDRGLRENRFCGCGAPFRRCPFWTNVLAASGLNLDHAAELDRFVFGRHLRTRRVAGTLRRLLRGKVQPEFREWLDMRRHLYSAIRSVSGSKTIIDTSKLPGEGLAVAFIQRTYIIHMVRDPRAVAWSWKKQKEGMGRISLPTSSAYWVAFNRATRYILAALAPRGVQSTVVRYEDFASDPLGTVRELSALASLGSGPSLQSDSMGRLRLTPSHTVAGNVRRFRTASIDIRVESEWRQQMRFRDRLIASAITSTDRGIYGY